MNKLFIVVAIFTCYLFSCQRNNQPQTNTPKPTLRVLGYLHSQHNWAQDIKDIDLKSITDLNLAFFNPTIDGKFETEASLKNTISEVHAAGVKVYMSIGGGAPPAHLGDWIKKEKRTEFIASILAAAKLYGFDGVDVDLENALINEDYAPFVAELAEVLKAADLKMTAALARWNSDLIHDTTLNRYDYINVMSYDKTGPWRPQDPGQHAPFSMIEADFNYYHQQRHIPADRLLLGLPFYGYGFGSGAPESMTYKNIVATYPGAEAKDSVLLAPAGVLYYNGIATIQQKTRFALKQKAAGVMIWQLKGDAKGEKSLLAAIHREALK